MMRILHLGAGNLFGGIETCQRLLAATNDAVDGLEQEFGYCFDALPAKELRKTGAPVHILGPARYTQPWTVLAVRARLRELLAARRPDAVICHEVWIHGLCASVVKQRRVPLGLWIHCPHSGWSILDQWSRWVRPDFLISNSHYSSRSMARLLPHVPEDVIYCPAEVDLPAETASRCEVRRRCKTPEGALVILQVGRWDPFKGHAVLIEALGRLQDRDDWVCWQVGAPQTTEEARYLEEIKQLAERRGIASRLRFLGQANSVELVAFRRAADVYCQPNTSPEPFGLTLVEALAAGLPVVTSAGGGADEILTPEVGVRVPPRNVDALAAALRELCERPKWRMQLGQAGPRRARELCEPSRQVRRVADFVARQVGSKVRNEAMTEVPVFATQER